MAKRKINANNKEDTKVASIVIGLFAAAILLFFIFSKSKEHKNENAVSPVKPASVSVPAETEQPVHPIPAEEPVTPLPMKSSAGSSGKIAFIIDDWGQSTANCKYLKEIPEPMAVSILPSLRHTKDVADCAKLYHKLTMLHLPLEALHNYDFYPPDYVIKTTMKPSLVSKIVDEDMSQLPSIEGVNNHMGSKATEDKNLMRIIFKKVKKKGLFFVDSMTAPHTVCAGLAGDMGMAIGKRDVFLDNINTREAIIKQIMILAQKAHRRGYAVAIGHDRHLTMQVLMEEIPILENHGFEIVSIKSLLKNK
jgi:polysaccharide deacetylase 2 family uncharacterized protein YibQ